MTARTRLLLPLIAAALLASACSSTSTSTAAPAAGPASSTGRAAPDPAAPTSARAVTIVIKDFAYEIPGPVAAGSRIDVRNDDSEAHTLSVQGHGKVVVKGGSTGSFTAPASSGTYSVTCDFHGDMHARLVVT